MASPSLSSLKTFEIVAKTGSLKAAAEVLHVTQSAVSHQLRRLEATLDQPLVVKQGRGVRLTAGGRALAGGLAEGFSRIDAAVNSIRGETAATRLRISCLPSIAVRWLIPRTHRFRHRYPHIALSFQYAGSVQGSLLPDIDVMITFVDAQPAKADGGMRLFSGTAWPVTSPLYLASQPKCETAAQLLDLELLHDEFYQPWENWFIRQGLHPSRLEEGIVYQDFNLLSAALIAGHGVALCPPPLIEEELANGTLIKLFDTPANTERQYWLFHHDVPGPAVELFCQWLREELDEVRND